MRQLFLAGSAIGAVLLWVTCPAAAQAPQTMAQIHKMPRTPDGHPDLQGVYDLATITPVERPSGASPTYTREQAAKIEAAAAGVRQAGDKALDGNRTAPPRGGDGSPGPAGNVGGYNLGWLDPGSTLNMVQGQIRSSIVIDPPDGRIPPMTAAAKARMTAVDSDEQEDSNDPGLEKAPGAYDNPERRPLGERCLLGFGSTAGPPALPDYFYNNLHQIVQTPNSIMILTEMVHDARIIRMNAQHLPKNIRLWMGDSVGRWEGDTLVVDTTNFTDKTRFRGSTENLHVVEHFRRVDDRTLLYRFTIEDPETWGISWTGEYAWPATDGKIYEYACHEGNYSLTDILKGARERDKQGTEAKPSTN